MAQLKYWDGSAWQIAATGVVGPTGPAGIGSMGYASGDYFGFTGSNTSQALTLNEVNYAPFYLPETITIDRIAARTHTVFSGTAVVRLGIYNCTNSKPSTVKFDAGTVSCTAASTTYQITINETLEAGWYFMAGVLQTAATNNTFIANTVNQAPILGIYNPTTLNLSVCFRQSGVSGAFATAGTLTHAQQSMVVAVRKT
jgi:hypothetical protein